jgi:hypothetical protein
MSSAEAVYKECALDEASMETSSAMSRQFTDLGTFSPAWLYKFDET